MFHGLAFLDKPLYLQRKYAAKPGSRDSHDGSVRRNLMLRVGLWFRMKPSTIDVFSERRLQVFLACVPHS